MNLTELKSKPVAELIDMATSHGIEGMASSIPSSGGMHGLQSSRASTHET